MYANHSNTLCLANNRPNPKCVFEAIAVNVAEWQGTTTLLLPSLAEVQDTMVKFDRGVQPPRASAVKRKGAPCSKLGLQARYVAAKGGQPRHDEVAVA